MLGSTADTCTAVFGRNTGIFLDYLGYDFLPLVSGCIRRVFLVRQWMCFIITGMGQHRGAQKFGLFWKMTSGVQLGSTVDTLSRAPLGDGK